VSARLMLPWKGLWRRGSGSRDDASGWIEEERWWAAMLFP